MFLFLLLAQEDAAALLMYPADMFSPEERMLRRRRDERMRLAHASHVLAHAHLRRYTPDSYYSDSDDSDDIKVHCGEEMVEDMCVCCEYGHKGE